ncbi:MAG: SDR family NAD(P)-dependent oxidoreductase [Archangium sp.]|nr:SDR family NAD(P)-dependent oxidoreductase [Archangium sp.]
MPALRPLSIASVPSLQGKKILITGANSGIGLEAAKALAAKGATVLLGCRDTAKGEAVATAIRALTPSATLHPIALDLASLASVRAGAAQVLERHSDLDVVVHNAGVMALPRTLTSDGIEMQFGVNHLGGFVLTALLAPALFNREGARIVSTTSLLAHQGRMNFDDLQGERSYDKSAAYNQSKLCNLLFTFELERRLRAAGRKAQAMACHPGYSATNLQRRGPEMEGSRFMGWMMAAANALVAQTAERGAQATVIAAGSPDIHGGELVGFDGLNEMRGNTAIMAPPKAALDEAAARQLWERSVTLSGVQLAV